MQQSLHSVKIAHFPPLWHNILSCAFVAQISVWLVRSGHSTKSMWSWQHSPSSRAPNFTTSSKVPFFALVSQSTKLYESLEVFNPSNCLSFYLLFFVCYPEQSKIIKLLCVNISLRKMDHLRSSELLIQLPKISADHTNVSSAYTTFRQCYTLLTSFCAKANSTLRWNFYQNFRGSARQGKK